VRGCRGGDRAPIATSRATSKEESKWRRMDGTTARDVSPVKDDGESLE
jgi:hypothetical protein